MQFTKNSMTNLISKHTEVLQKAIITWILPSCAHTLPFSLIIKTRILFRLCSGVWQDLSHGIVFCVSFLLLVGIEFGLILCDDVMLSVI